MVVIVSGLCAGVASLIGLDYESKEFDRERISQNSTFKHNAQAGAPGYGQWQQDEIQEKHLEMPSYGDQSTILESSSCNKKKKKKKVTYPTRLADDFLKRHPAPTPPRDITSSNQRLSRPVIIAQRRPQERLRGFHRAYSPELDEFNIDQIAFIEFISAFNNAGIAPMWMGLINLIGLVGFAVPDHYIGFAIGFAIQVLNSILMELIGRAQAYNFMRKLNDGYFRPRGLYCLTMSLECTHEGAMSEETLARCISEDLQAKGFMRKFKTVKGVSGPLGFPESASLVYPVPKWFKEEKMGGWERFWKFAGDCYDRRGQAIYAFNNPNSLLALPPRQPFTSKFGDPTNSTNWSFISLITGGRREYDSSQRPGAPRPQDVERGTPRNRQEYKLIYMIIVNMPSEAKTKRATRDVSRRIA